MFTRETLGALLCRADLEAMGGDDLTVEKYRYNACAYRIAAWIALWNELPFPLVLRKEVWDSSAGFCSAWWEVN